MSTQSGMRSFFKPKAAENGATPLSKKMLTVGACVLHKETNQIGIVTKVTDREREGKKGEKGEGERRERERRRGREGGEEKRRRRGDGIV